jgi:hypothetical protein
MVNYDDTQTVLKQYLDNTKRLLNALLSNQFYGTAQIKVVSDLGFPHDVIRIAGGFATGAYVNWNCERLFVPVDTCVNVCSASCFEITEDIMRVFNTDHFTKVKNDLSKGIYIRPSLKTPLYKALEIR